MNRPPELELALILRDYKIKPHHMLRAITENGGILTLKTLAVLFEEHDRNKLLCIISVMLGAGTIKPIEKTDIPLESRRWVAVEKILNTLLANATVISDSIPFLKSLYGNDNIYTISATIPDGLVDLEKYYGIFENTVLGIRRLVEHAETDLLMMVPFIDEKGFFNILESVCEAIKRGIKVIIISRHLSEGKRNRAAISGIIELNAECRGNLELFEAGLNKDVRLSHAKIISRDAGEEVYIGSANFTKSSMETAIEMGVFLRGSNARPVHDFIWDIVKNCTSVRI